MSRVAESGPFKGNAIRRARKPGPCSECRETINKGQEYIDGDVDPYGAGGFAKDRVCLECANVPVAQPIRADNFLVDEIDELIRRGERDEADHRVARFRAGFMEYGLHGQNVALWTAGRTRLTQILKWYEGTVENCRKLSREGEDARRALDDDGGDLATEALALLRATPTPPAGDQ